MRSAPLEEIMPGVIITVKIHVYRDLSPKAETTSAVFLNTYKYIHQFDFRIFIFIDLVLLSFLPEKYLSFVESHEKI